MAKRFGKYKVTDRYRDLLLRDSANSTPASLTVDTDALCVFNGGGVNVGHVNDPGDNNLSVAGQTQVTGSVICTGLHDKNVTAQSGTGAEDLTATSTNLLWHAATAQASAITLPQATAANAGMVITCIAGANWATSPFKLGFASGGGTVMAGVITLGAADGSEAVDAFQITDDSKNLVIDADDATAAGGAVGSIYRFYYISNNLVFCEARGMCTTGTPALDAAASVTGGI